MPPASGTLRILPRMVAQKTGDYQSGTAGVTCGSLLPSMSDNDIAAYLNADGGGIPAVESRWTKEAYCDPDCFGVFPGAGVHLLKFTPATDEIIFNPGGGQEVIDFLSGNFPKGILISALQVQFIGIASKLFSVNDAQDFKLIFGNTDVHTVAIPAINGTVNSGATVIIPGGTSKGIVSGLSFFGVSLTHVENSEIFTACGTIMSSQSEFRIRNLRLIANYTTWSAGLKLSPGLITLTPNNLVPAGTRGMITDTNNKLNQLTGVNAYYRESDGDLIGPFAGTIITQSAGEVIFSLPEFAITAGASIIITGIGNGVEFSGEVNIGYMSQAGLVNGSGLYRLVSGQRYDTYYDRSVSPVTTVNMAIPTPRAKTGYFDA